MSKAQVHCNLSDGTKAFLVFCFTSDIKYNSVYFQVCTYLRLSLTSVVEGTVPVEVVVEDVNAEIGFTTGMVTAVGTVSFSELSSVHKRFGVL